MRIIGTFKDEKLAHRFVAFLAKEGLEAEVRSDLDDSEFGVWGYQEDQLERSRNYYENFKHNPDDKRFQVPVLARPKAKQEPSPNRHRYVDVRSEVFGAASATNIVTMSLIAVSVLLTILVEIPAYQWLRSELMFSNYIRPMFLEIRQGEVWRLVTPIFLHAGFLHILFNMLWLHTLGGQIEQQESSRFLSVFVFLTAVIVNTAQYLVTPAPFLGMSGVVYALFGFVWMMAKYKVGSRYEMSDFTVKIMLFWLVFCLFLPQIANTQHFVGAGLGAGFGFFYSGGLKAAIRRRRHRNRFK